MNVVLLNQYRMIVDRNKIDGEIGKIFRTKKSLDDLKQNIRESNDIDSIVVDSSEWQEEGQVLCVYAKVANSYNNINRIRTFMKNGFKCDFGEEGYFTMDEILKRDLAIVKGFGFISTDEDREKFKKAFKEAVQNL